MVEEAAISMGINLASTAVCAATALGRGKAEQLVRERSIDRDLDDLNTEFGEALEEAIEDSNAGSDVGELAGVADNWDAVAREVHGLSTESTGETGGASQARERLAFASEEEVIDTLAEAIASVQGYDLSETGGLERELKQALSVAYQRSLDSFIDRIAGTERADKLVVESQLEQLDELRTVLKRLAELEAKFSTPQHYDLTDVEAEGLDAAAEGLALTGPDLEFVDRPELADHYDGHRRLLVGRGGSGKSRALAELVENYEREVARVVRPREAFNDAEDFRRLRNEGFEDDVLLVWDDIHDIAPEQDNAIFRKTVTKLAAALPGDATLHVLAAARVEGLETLSGNPRAEYGSDLWADFEVIELEPLAAEVLAGIFVRTLDHDELEVEASEEVREQFLRKALETDPSPLYVTSVVETAGERLTEADIEEIPDDALGIWTEEYEDIRRERTEWADERHRYVLLAFKILKEIGITPYHSLVEGVYDEVLGRDALELGPRLDELERRQWFVERETDDGAVLYEMHDVKAEAVDESVERQARDLSEFFRESLECNLPRDVDGLERICHGQLALYLASADVRRGPELAEKHHLEIIGEAGIDPDDEVTHSNYGNLLQEELGSPEEAATHYERAIDINPQYAKAHYNYGNLLKNELGSPEEAATHYERAIDINPQDAKTHHNYGTLLWPELDRPEEAREHLETSVGLWLERGIVGNALNDLRMLVLVCRALDDSAGTVENCDRALSLLDELDGDHSDDWRWFQSQQVLADDDAETPELYQMALLNVRASEPSQAVKLLSAAWNRRDEHAEETGELGAARAAGVAFAVHAEISDDGDIPPADEILAELDPDDLHEPENVLYEQLTGGDPGTDGESLFSRGEEHREEGEKFAALEAEAFGILLGQLT